MKASALGNFVIVEYLVETCKADMNPTDKDGYTALRLATEHGYQRIRQYLTGFLLAKQPKAPAVATTNESFTGETPLGAISPFEIELINFVKTGNVGGEFHAKWLDAAAAVKLFLPGASSFATFEDEVRLWHQLRHPNVIKMYGACNVRSLPLQFFVCEYSSNGSLLDYVKSAPLAERTLRSFLHQAALGLEYLHERGIIHGDRRCSNILIGSDGLAKLTNFGKSYSLQSVGLRASSSKVGSMRWKSPEVLNGKQPSFSSDIYSFGMCILEALTWEMPWKNYGTDIVSFIKQVWAPEVGQDQRVEPFCPRGEARSLVWSMCSQDPAKRRMLSLVVHDLERLAFKELWTDVQTHMVGCEIGQYHHAFNELEQVYEYLQTTTHSSTIFTQFHSLLRDFRQTIAMSSEQARILQLSASKAPTSSIVAFRRRLRSLWTVLGETKSEMITELRERWEIERREQIELFVSDASMTYVLLESLKSQEERAAFLISLKTEMEQPSKYTPGQLQVLKKAYDDIASKLKTDDLSELAPEWFIPWYELVVDKYNSLGRGGFGSVFRAKWLDSDVVVKYLTDAGDEMNMSSTLYWYDSACIAPEEKDANRRKTMVTFQHEVDIWFRFNHPHVVRLFGACHVGRPFFVCEYATNGTLISYLKKHPDELWAKLHEAALGIQYLHAVASCMVIWKGTTS